MVAAPHLGGEGCLVPLVVYVAIHQQGQSPVPEHFELDSGLQAIEQSVKAQRHIRGLRETAECRDPRRRPRACENPTSGLLSLGVE